MAVVLIEELLPAALYDVRFLIVGKDKRFRTYLSACSILILFDVDFTDRLHTISAFIRFFYIIADFSVRATCFLFFFCPEFFGRKNKKDGCAVLFVYLQFCLPFWARS